MANRVQVEFGASVGELKSAVDDVNSSLDSIKSHVEGVGNAFVSLAALAGVALSFEGFKSTFDQLADFADQMQDAQARMGGSLEDMTTLSGVAKMTGVSFEALTQSVVNANRQMLSAKDGFSPTTQALNALGLSARQLQGLSTDAWFSKVSDAVSRFNPSVALTATVQQAFGQGMAALMPLLIEGGDHFAELEKQVRKAQAGLAATLPGLSETKEKLTVLGLQSQTFAAQVFTTLKPAIDAAIDGFARLVGSITTDDIRDAANKVANALIDIAAAVMRFFAQLGVTIDNFQNKLSDTFKLDLNLGYIDGPAEKALEYMAKLTGNYERMKDTFSKPISLDFNPPASFPERFGGSSIDDELKSIDAMASRAHDAVNSAIPHSGSWESVTQDIDRMSKSVQELGDSWTKANIVEPDAGLKSKMAAQAAAIEAEITAQRSRLAQIKEILNSEAASYKITEQQKALYTETAIAQAYQAEMALMAQKEKLYAGDALKYAEVEREKAKLTAQYQQDMLKTVEASQRQLATSIQSGLSSVTSAFNSQLSGLLSKTTSWAQAAMNVGKSLFMRLIELGEDWVIKHGAAMIADSVMQKTQAASQVVTQAATEAAKTEATLAGTAARAAAETTGSAAGIGAQISNAVTSVGIDAGKVFAGVFGFLAPLMGPAAAGPAEASSAATLARGLTPLAVGAWEIPSTQPYLLHPGEMVVPQNFASGLRSSMSGSGGGGGAGGSMVFAPNFSGFIGTQAMINQIMPQLARGLRAYQNLNPSTT